MKESCVTPKCCTTCSVMWSCFNKKISLDATCRSVVCWQIPSLWLSHSLPPVLPLLHMPRCIHGVLAWPIRFWQSPSVHTHRQRRFRTSLARMGSGSFGARQEVGAAMRQSQAVRHFPRSRGCRDQLALHMPELILSSSLCACKASACVQMAGEGRSCGAGLYDVA